MSREWARHSFQAAAPHEGFVGTADTARRVAGPRSFAPEDPVTWRNADGFVRLGEGFAPAQRMAPPPRQPGPVGFVPFSAFGAPPAPHEADDAAPSPAEPAPSAADLAADAIRAEAFAAGFADGERQAHAAMSGEAAACARLIVGLTGTPLFDRPTLATRLQQTVLHLVTQIVGELGIAPERLAERVEGAVSMLADTTEPARVYLHPEDLALIGAHLPAHVAAVANAQIERGGFRMETLSATIEDGPTLWLEQLSAALDKVPLGE